APADWPRLVLGIAPNHARIDARWPVVDIWRRHQTESDDLPALDWRAGSRALVWREGVRPVVVGLSVAQAALFDALCAGTALGPALSQAAALQADINPGEFLNSLAQSGLLNSAQLP
ncbi:MAG: hypothetical protein JO370_16485, partial [Paucibacter sp.]|nr:hypothetical protein [Roseateles sp.]